MSVYVCIYMDVGTHGHQKKPSDPLGARAPGSCELPNVDSGNYTQVICKSKNSTSEPSL